MQKPPQMRLTCELHFEVIDACLDKYGLGLFPIVSCVFRLKYIYPDSK
jgi:hypothetical protein